MARSHYIYLIRNKACNTVLAAFTVKYEAQQWAVRKSGRPLKEMQLSSIRDGTCDDKTEKLIPWATTGPGTPGEPPSLATRNMESSNGAPGFGDGRTADGMRPR